MGVFAAGLAAASLPLLDKIIGGFGDPKPLVRVFVGVAVVAGTLALDRLAGRRAESQQEEARQAVLRNALRAWPVPQLRFADPLDLGVFPAIRRYRGTEGRGKYYIPRGLEAAIEEALEDSFFVLVHGARGAGKSRTAFHAARSKFPEADVIAPRDGKALLELLDQELPRSRGSKRLVLWLDGLERYADVIDSNVLDRVMELGGREKKTAIRVVGTIETKTWGELLSGGGQGAEAAKAIAARSRAFELRLELSQPEREQAARLYGQTDLSGGFGAGLGATGAESDAPLMPPRPQVPDDESVGPGPWRRDGRLLGPAALCSGLIGLLGWMWIDDRLFEKEPQPTDVQVSRIERGLAAGTPNIRGRRVALHGSGEKAYVYEITDRGHSHELRVYDVRGDTVEQAFRFRPKPIGHRYEFVGALDVDDDGREELVGGYRSPENGTLLPFMIEWDAGVPEYRFVPLQPNPEIRSRAAQDPAYSRPVRLRDHRKPDEVFIRGYPVGAVAVSGEVNVRLLTGYNARDIRRRLRVHPSIFAFGDNEPRFTPCHLPDRDPIWAEPDPGLLPNSRVRKAWDEASEKKDCAPD